MLVEKEWNLQTAVILSPQMLAFCKGFPEMLKMKSHPKPFVWEEELNFKQGHTC